MSHLKYCVYFFPLPLGLRALIMNHLRLVFEFYCSYNKCYIFNSYIICSHFFAFASMHLVL